MIDCMKDNQEVHTAQVKSECCIWIRDPTPSAMNVVVHEMGGRLAGLLPYTWETFSGTFFPEG